MLWIGAIKEETPKRNTLNNWKAFVRVNIKGEIQYKPKYTKVRINKNDLDKAMKLLKDNGIDFKL